MAMSKEAAAQFFTKVKVDAEEECAQRTTTPQALVDHIDEFWLRLIGELKNERRRLALAVIERIMRTLVSSQSSVAVAVGAFVVMREHLKCTGEAFLSWAGERTGDELVAETTRVRDAQVERQTHRDALKLALELTAVSYELRTSLEWMRAPSYPINVASYAPCTGQQRYDFMQNIRRKLVERLLSPAALADSLALVLEAVVSWRDERVVELLAKTYRHRMSEASTFGLRLRSYYESAMGTASGGRDPFQLEPERRVPTLMSALLFYAIVEDISVILPISAYLRAAM